MPRLFFLGTDTDVGKTRVATYLVGWLNRRHIPAIGFKPIESGCLNENGQLQPRDGLAHVAASHGLVTLDEISLYRMVQPITPSVAAESEGVHIEIGEILRTADQLEERCDWLVVEGAGGLLSPLWKRTTNLEFLASLGATPVLVARSALGTINHTLLTLRALESAGFSKTVVLLNRCSPDTTADEATNAAVIRQFTDSDIVGPFPWLESGVAETADAVMAELEAVISRRRDPA
ncbi:MAG: dethiobiotin synthase [Myxococcales bacterium]|nr:dethiobiotin synthase [Myxococcales bacterium]